MKAERKRTKSIAKVSSSSSNDSNNNNNRKPKNTHWIREYYRKQQNEEEVKKTSTEYTMAMRAHTKLRTEPASFNMVQNSSI